MLAGIGAPQALEVAEEKLKHADPRVRAEAIATAVHLARQQAVPLLLSAFLRRGCAGARARGNAGLPVSVPAIEQGLLRLLQSNEEESVQTRHLSDTRAVSNETAREALLQLLIPRPIPSIGIIERRSALRRHYRAGGASQTSHRERGAGVCPA